jgi:hypothetical protein
MTTQIPCGRGMRLENGSSSEPQSGEDQSLMLSPWDDYSDALDRLLEARRSEF